MAQITAALWIFVFLGTSLQESDGWLFRRSSRQRQSNQQRAEMMTSIRRANERRQSVCGIPEYLPNVQLARIVGGDAVKPHSWPWQVSLKCTKNIHRCGGILIQDQWVLTAAHCLHGEWWRNSARFWRVDAGAHQKSGAETTVQRQEVEKLIIHEGYRHERSHDNDIALMKLKNPVRFNANVLPVCLPSFQVQPGTGCYATGWGATENTGSNAILRQVQLPVISQSTCLLSGAAYRSSLTGNMLCAGNINGGMDTCQGDSGGPFVCKSDTGAWQVHGITSWGKGCADAGKPGVYTKVIRYLDWIKDNILANSNSEGLP